MSLQPHRRYTVEEYIEFESAAEDKHEFFGGEIFAMVGASYAHASIAGNIAAALHAQLRHRPCRVTGSDTRVKVSATGLYTYPDVVIVCGEPQLERPGETLLNPSVLIEVLSDSTEKKDRGWKFEQYRQIASLSDYLLAAQDTPRVEHFARASDGDWVYRCETQPNAKVLIASIGCALMLQEVYEKVQAMREPLALYRAASMAI